MPLSDWNDGARTAGQTLGGGGNFSGMGGYGGAGGSVGGGNYTFRQVPGTNTFGNWNTGGPVAGFGGLGGITSWGGGFGPVGPSLAAPGGYADPVLSGPLGPVTDYTQPAVPTYAEPAFAPPTDVAPEPAPYTSVPGLISPGWNPAEPSYPGVEAELGYDPNAGWEPSAPSQPIGGMSYTPGLPGPMSDPYAGQTVAPGKTDLGAPSDTLSSVLGRNPYDVSMDRPSIGDAAGHITGATQDGFAALPNDVPSNPIGGMSYTPGLPSPQQPQISNYDYLRTTPGPAGMDYTPDLPQEAYDPFSQQSVAEGKTDSLLGGLGDYDNLVAGNDMFRDAMAMGARPTRVSLMNAMMPYSDPYSTGGAFSNLADYSGVSRKRYADRVPY